MHMNLNITKIAEIQYGTYEKTHEQGDVKYLNVGHFDDFGKLTQFSDSFLKSDDKNMKFLLSENDVLFAAKGSRNFAWAYKNEHGPCIPSSAFYIIRLNPDVILGEYLASFLNTNRIQYLIKQMVTGSGMPSIPKKEFLQLDITVPPINEQQKLIDIALLMDNDIELTNELLNAKITLKEGLMDKLIINQNRT